jgi:tetratricopeptide (TPR) repeat protein
MALVLGGGCAGGSSGGKDKVDASEALAAALEHGEAAFKDGEYAEAGKAFEEARRLQPDNQRAVVAGATCFLKTHQVKGAHDLLVDYLGRHPGDVAARLTLARTLLRGADFDAAAVELRKVREADPQNLLALYNLGFIAYRNGQYDEARRLLEEAIRVRPDHPEAHYTLGLVALAQGRSADAVAALKETVRLDPNHVGAHFNLARAATLAGQADLAASEGRAFATLSGKSKAETEKSEQVKAQSLKAVQALMAEDFEGALKEYQALLTRYPDHAPLYNDIGRVQLRLGRRDDALASLRRAAELDPRLSEPHYLLSNLYRERGDQAAAERELQTFATLETIPEGKSGY